MIYDQISAAAGDHAEFFSSDFQMSIFKRNESIEETVVSNDNNDVR